MKKELEDKLFSIHSSLFVQRNSPGSVTRMCDGICTGDGWFDLIDNMCKELQALSDETGSKIEFFQVKEKFGGLRVYIQGCSEEAQAIIYKYEEISYNTCELCGSTDNVKLRDVKGWMESTCLQCYADRQNK